MGYSVFERNSDLLVVILEISAEPRLYNYFVGFCKIGMMPVTPSYPADLSLPST